MSDRYLILLPVLALWVAVAALSWLVGRELGWSRLRKHAGALFLLLGALSILPAAGVYRVTRPYQKRILALVQRKKGPEVALAAGCSVFPENNIWNTRVRDLPLDARSAAYVQSIGRDLTLHPDFGPVAGIPYAVAAADQAGAQVTFTDFGAESDPGPYRIPDTAPVEDNSDGHVLVVDPRECRLYELYTAKRVGPLKWQAGAGAIFDLRSNRLRPDGWTSTDAAGFPVFAGLVRYDEVKAGVVRHAFRFTIPHTRRAYVWPARHRASTSEDPSHPPMGQRFRLRASFDTSGFDPEAQVILTALKDYGMMLADNGSPWFLSGAPDSRWSSRAISDLRKVKGSDFEAVDTSSLMVQPDSAEARTH